MFLLAQWTGICSALREGWLHFYECRGTILSHEDIYLLSRCWRFLMTKVRLSLGTFTLCEVLH